MHYIRDLLLLTDSFMARRAHIMMDIFVSPSFVTSFLEQSVSPFLAVFLYDTL